MYIQKCVCFHFYCTFKWLYAKYYYVMEAYQGEDQPYSHRYTQFLRLAFVCFDSPSTTKWKFLMRT